MERKNGKGQHKGNKIMAMIDMAPFAGHKKVILFKKYLCQNQGLEVKSD